MESDRISKEESRASMEDSTFDNLEQDFQAVLKELMGDKSLEKFRVEYEKLHRALKKSHDSEKRLMQKCHDLNSEIIVNTTKVTAALKMSQEDRTTITTLKQEIEKLWKMVDTGHEKEARANETINQLKMEISNLTKLIEQGAGLNLGQDSNLQELMKEKDQLTKERDEQLQEITQLRNKLKEAIQLQKAAETQQDEAEAAILELREQITVKSQEVERETRRKTKLEKELQAAKVDLDVRGSEVKQKQHLLQQAEEEHCRTEQQLKEARLANELAMKDADLLNMKLSKLQQDYEQQMMSSEALAGENSEKMAQLRVKEDEVANLKQDFAKIQKIRDNLQRRLKAVEENKKEIETSRDGLKQKITSLEKDIEDKSKEIERMNNSYDILVRERDGLSKSVRKAEGFTEKQEHLVKIHDQTIKNLQQEILNYREEAKKQRNLISELERDRDRYGKDASDATQNCLQQMEEVKMKEMELFQMKKKIVEEESKLKQQQTLYEAVCRDRNACSKTLIESKDELTETQRKLKIMSHQISQLKDEIASKEGALAKSNMELTHVEREKEALSSELSSRKTELESIKQTIEGQKSEEVRLKKIINQADVERQRQKKELEQVINERDILGTQLIRRNDELALLYEKIKIQQSTMSKGEAQYKQRLEDIRILKLNIKRMRREKNILSRSVANVEDLRRELFHVQREILKERTRCKALEEELENPMNIHRWRKLEGSDPSTFEMLQKIQTLQRRLIQKTEEVVEKELLIQEKEKLYMELKHILARQPGPEVAEQLQIYQQTLKEKTKQMKSMASELNMYESQVSENKVEVERLSRELQEVKKKYFLQKKKEMSVKERERALIQTMAPPIIPTQKSDMPRYTGGGFNLKQAQRTTA